MHVRNILFYISLAPLCCAFVSPAFAQENAALPGSSSPFKLILPTYYGWSTVQEGQTVSFKLQTTGGKGGNVQYAITKGLAPGMTLDSTGTFTWTPTYDIADRLNNSAAVAVLFEAKNDAEEVATYDVVFKVVHTNRPPELDELKPFYVLSKTQNTYKIDPGSVSDPDNDTYVFIPVLESLPEGMQLSEAGLITWEPSISQFNSLKANPQYVDFWVEDQPFKARTKGRIKLEPTQKDLAPSITVVPKTLDYRVKENSIINIKFFLSDPNGDDDIAKFNFVSDNKSIPAKALVKNTETNYEFIWEPGYDFVKEPIDTIRFHITFFVLDKSQNREEKRFSFAIGNTIDEEQRDAYLYNLYREAMVSSWTLMEQMVEKENELKRNYRRAKRGKSQRSVLSASLGATTGLSPVIAKNNQDRRNQITTIGGTSIATIGTLEATEVIGKSVKDLLERFNYVMEKKNEIQTKGDSFAREFSSKASRLRPDFIKQLDAFKASMNVKGLVALELDANWESKKVATDKEIQKRFKDFTVLNNAN